MDKTQDEAQAADFMATLGIDLSADNVADTVGPKVIAASSDVIRMLQERCHGPTDAVIALAVATAFVLDQGIPNPTTRASVKACFLSILDTLQAGHAQKEAQQGGGEGG